MELTSKQVRFIAIGEAITLGLLLIMIALNIVMGLHILNEDTYQPTDVNRDGEADLTDLSVLAHQLNLENGGLIEELCR